VANGALVKRSDNQRVHKSKEQHKLQVKNNVGLKCGGLKGRTGNCVEVGNNIIKS